jgi:predicted DNA-binding protein
MSSGTAPNFSLIMSPELKGRIREQAWKERTTSAGLIRRTILEYLAEHEESKEKLAIVGTMASNEN